MRTIHQSIIVLAACLTLAAVSARAQTTIFSNDFSAIGLTNANAQFSVDTNNAVFNYASAQNITSLCSDFIDGVAGTNFVISTRFVLNNRGNDTANLSTVGYGAFSTANNFAATSANPNYLADWGINTTGGTLGQLRILKQGVTANFTAAMGNSGAGSVVSGNTYELRLSGTYSNTTLTLTLAVFDGSGNQLGSSASATDTAPLTGKYFGYRNRSVSSTAQISMSYDYFTVYVPAALLGPSFVTVPKAQTKYFGDNVIFNTLASGTAPITYQWLTNSVAVTGATNVTYVFSNAAYTPNFSVVASNSINSITSAPVALTLIPKVENGILTPLWTVAVGDRGYLTSSDTERGLAYNTLSNHVLVASRAAANIGVYVLDGDTGADLRTLNISTVTSGTLSMNCICAADDGAVYLANLVSDPTAIPFTIYRWPTDDAGVLPNLAYQGDMGGVVQRWGDTMAVRGSGTNTQIIVSSLGSGAIAVFTTTDGANFTPTIMNVPGVENGAFVTGLTFGAGDTFWGKAAGLSLRQCSFDLNSVTATVLQTYTNLPSGMGPIGVEPSKNALVGIVVDTPDNAQYYTIANAIHGPTMVEQEALPTDNANPRFAGAANFGNNRLYVLGTGNGIAAFTVNYGRVPFWLSQVPGSGVNLQWDSIAGKSYQVQYKTNLTDASWTNLGSPTNAAGSTATMTDSQSGANALFYRVIGLP